MTLTSSSSQVGPSGTSSKLAAQDNDGIVRNIPVQGPTTPPPSTPRATHSKKKSPHSKQRDTASSQTPRTQPLSYYIETAIAAEFHTAEESPSVVQRNKASAWPIAATASSSSIQTPVPSSVPRAVAVAPPPTSSIARRAALEAHAQAQHLPPQDVFLNLFEAMCSSVAADFQNQYNAHQIRIAAQQNQTEAKLADAEKQVIQLRERLLSVEKLRSEERGRWEVERKNLMRQLEQGENEVERQERKRIQDEEARREKEEQDRISRKLVEKYEAKKKVWAKERNEMLRKVNELEQENRRLEDVITNDDQLLAKQLQDLEEENKEREESMEDERDAWEVQKNSLIHELSQTKNDLEFEKRMYGEVITTMNEMQKEINILQKEKEELSTQCRQQKEKWDGEKLIMVTKLKEERANSTHLRNELYEREAKRKRGDEMVWTRDKKKAKLGGHGNEDEESEDRDDEMEEADAYSEGAAEEWEGVNKEWEGAEKEWEGASEEWERANEGLESAEEDSIRAGEEREGATEELCGVSRGHEFEEEQESSADDFDGADTECAGAEESLKQQLDEDSDEQEGFYVSEQETDDGDDECVNTQPMAAKRFR